MKDFLYPGQNLGEHLINTDKIYITDYEEQILVRIEKVIAKANVENVMILLCLDYSTR